jgi:ATP-dependent Clp protease ATP-binding subunit ClpC
MSRLLELEVLIVVEELSCGDFLAWPFADREKIAYGHDRDDALEQQQLFLRDHLATLPAGELARFAPGRPHALAGERDDETPPPPAPGITVRLHGVDVLLQPSLPGFGNATLSDRIKVSEPLRFPCLVVPEGKHAWVVVLPLDHAMWVEDPEQLDQQVAREIERVVAAREPSGLEFLELLRGADPYSLEHLVVVVDREERRDPSARAAKRRRLARERSQAEARSLLGKIGTSLLDELRLPLLPPVLHREREIAALDALLRGRERLALMLVGPELAGKTAVVHGLVQRWLAHDRKTLPEIVSTSGAQLVAGQSGFGQLEQRIHDVMAAAETLDAILYFDNLADLFARTSGELGDVAASVRPWLERGRVRLLGEITPELLEHHEKRHVGFFAPLARLAVPELDAKKTHAIVVARAEHDRKYEPARPTLSLPPTRDAVTPLIDLAERYFSYQAFPGKALRFAAALRATHEGDLDDTGKPKPIGPDEVYRGFSIHSGIPMFLLREERALEFDRIVEFFATRVIGQTEAIHRVAQTLCTVKAGLQPQQKPLATFLFVGPTGVGKTEVAKTLARFLFGSPERMTRFDMSEYMDPLAAERLIRGSDREDGILTRKVRQQPFCVLLLDEIEKAHYAVFDLLLQVCGEGRLSDARGRTTWFHNAIIIMTSNLGAAHRRPSSGFGGGRESAFDASAAERYYLEQVTGHFRPEFVNRIDRVIPFHPLDRAQIEQVATVTLARVRERDGIGERGITLELDAATIARLAREGYSDTYGARALRRELEDRLVAPLARTLAAQADRSEGASVRVHEAPPGYEPPRKSSHKGERLLAREVHEGLDIEVTLPSGKVARRTLDALERVAAQRRSATAALELGPIRELRDRHRMLIAELGYGAHKRKKDRTAWEHAAELGRLQAELGRLQGTIEQLDRLGESISNAEELTIAALYENESAELYLDAGDEAYREFRKVLVDALLLGDERHAITILVQEQDTRGALLYWLLPLFDALDEQGWKATLHVHGDDAPPERGVWPTGRLYGPPRAPQWVRERLLADVTPDARGHTTTRKWRDVVVCLEGRHVGAFVGAQLGLHTYEHRWLHERKRDESKRPAQLVVRVVSMRATIELAEWSEPPLVALVKPYRREELDKMPSRLHFDAEGRLQGTIVASAEPLALSPAELWSRLDEVMFVPLVEQAFAHQD